MNKSAKSLLIAACALIAGGIAGPSARADILAVNPSQDAMIFGRPNSGGDTGNASGAGPAFFAGADGAGNIKRSLLLFNLSAIPANAAITSVSLTLTLAQIAGSGGGSPSSPIANREFGLYDLLQPWTEGTSGSPTSPSVGGTGQGYPRTNGDVTWDYASYNSDPNLAIQWTSNGTPIEGGNFSSTESAQLTVNTTTLPSVGSTFTWSSAGMVADVQSWIDGTTPNDGWLLKSDNLESTPTSFLGFWSKEGAAANNEPTWAPLLSVTYTLAGTPVPEPGSLALLSLATPLLLTRRRKTA